MYSVPVSAMFFLAKITCTRNEFSDNGVRDINCTGRVNLEGLRGSQSNLVDMSFNDKASSWICY